MQYLVYHFRWDNLLAELVNVMGWLHRIASKYFTKKESSSRKKGLSILYCKARTAFRQMPIRLTQLCARSAQHICLLRIGAANEWTTKRKHYCANYINLLSTTVLYDFISVEMFATIRNPSFIIESFFSSFLHFFRQIFCNLLEFKAKNSTHHLREDGKKGRDKILL